MTNVPVTSLPLAVAADHPAFPGHFPSWPIVPGVVLLDESLRAIRADSHASVGNTQARIGSAKFLSIVTPGEPVRLEFESSASGRYRLRVFAGRADAERLAMTGSIEFASD